MMSLQMSKNIELLSEDGKQATACLMSFVQKAHGSRSGAANNIIEGTSSKNLYNIKVQIYLFNRCPRKWGRSNYK